LADFIDLKRCKYGELIDVEDSEQPFAISGLDDNCDVRHHRFFLPKEYVNEFPFKINETIDEVLNSELKDDGLVVTVKPTEKFLNYLRTEKYL
jgi:hypothetical protein